VCLEDLTLAIDFSILSYKALGVYSNSQNSVSGLNYTYRKGVLGESVLGQLGNFSC